MDAEITLRVNGEERRLSTSTPRTTAARRAARAARAHRRQEGLRPRPVRRLHRAASTAGGSTPAWPRRRRTTAPTSRPSRAWPTATTCTRCSRRSSSTTPSSAATARPGQICSAVGMLDEAARGWPSAVTDDLAPTAELDDDEIRERMSGNLCRCGAYANIVAGDRARSAPMRPFAYERAADAARRGRRRSPAPGARYLGGGTNLVDLMKLGVETPDAPRRRHRACRSTRIEETADGGLRIGAAVPQQRPRRRPRASASATRCSSQALLAGRLGPAAQHGHGRRQPAAAHPLRRTSRTSPSRATSASRARGCPAREGDHRNLAILGHSRRVRRHAPVGHGRRAGRARRRRPRPRARTATRTIPLAEPPPAARRRARSATPCSSPAS